MDSSLAWKKINEVEAKHKQNPLGQRGTWR